MINFQGAVDQCIERAKKLKELSKENDKENRNVEEKKNEKIDTTKITDEKIDEKTDTKIDPSIDTKIDTKIDEKKDEKIEITKNDEFQLSSMTTLVLDGASFHTLTDKDKEFLSKFTNLKKLCCNQTGLTTLENFPEIPTLKTFELTDNRLSSFEDILRICPNIRRLILGGNKIRTISQIQCLKELPSLEALHLEMTALAASDGFRTHVFDVLPSLTSLDGTDKNNVELDDEDDDEDEDEYNDDEEDENDDDYDSTLKDFYAKDYESSDDEDDEFAPEGDEQPDEDIDEEEDEVPEVPAPSA